MKEFERFVESYQTINVVKSSGNDPTIAFNGSNDWFSGVLDLNIDLTFEVIDSLISQMNSKMIEHMVDMIEVCVTQSGQIDGFFGIESSGVYH